MDNAGLEHFSPRDRRLLDALGHGARQGFGERPALAVIDTNYEFCGARRPIEEVIAEWPTACGDVAWAAVAVMRRLIDAAHVAAIPVFYTTNTRRPDGFDSGSWRWKRRREPGANHPRPRMPRADDIVDEIAPAPQDVIVRKTKPSGFYGTPFESFLTDLKVDSLIVCGGTTSGCVRATVVDAFSRNLRCAVVAEACFDRFETSHAVTLVDLHHKYADVVDADAALGFMAGLPAGLFDLPSGYPGEGTVA